MPSTGQANSGDMLDAEMEAHLGCEKHQFDLPVGQFDLLTLAGFFQSHQTLVLGLQIAARPDTTPLEEMVMPSRGSW